jgi:hypothetical protein
MRTNIYIVWKRFFSTRKGLNFVVFIVFPKIYRINTLPENQQMLVESAVKPDLQPILSKGYQTEGPHL